MITLYVNACYLLLTCYCDDRGQDRRVLENKWFYRSDGLHCRSLCKTNMNNSRLDTNQQQPQSRVSDVWSTHRLCKRKNSVFIPGVLEMKAPLRLSFTPGSNALRVCGEESHLSAAENVIKRQPTCVTWRWASCFCCVFCLHLVSIYRCMYVCNFRVAKK